MPTKVNYGLPTAIMAAMLGMIIILVVVIPATTFNMARMDVNPDLSVQGGDYKPRKDYTDLELYGRGIYMSEGCFYCHSQQTRYQDRGMGPAAIPQEYEFDAPHLLGSARTGPDLAREGGKYPSRWHIQHHVNPRSKSAGSIMPSFKHLEEESLVFNVSRPIDSEGLLHATPTELRAALKLQGGTETDRALSPEETVLELRAIGYTDYDIQRYDGSGVKRMDALVAYIQSLGPHRMYEPGDPVQMYERVDQPFDRAAQAQTEAPVPPPAAVAAPAKPAGPQDYEREAAEFSAYWVPTEYQDLAKKAKDDNKIPAFEPRFIVNGRGIFLEKCASCHGPNGQGNGPAGRYMEKKPANFWLPQFKHYSDAMWFYRVAEGVPGTQMPQWKRSLKQRKERQKWDQVWYLVTWLKYVAQSSPMQPVPYDVPPQYYLFDQDRERRSMLPVDGEFVDAYHAALDALPKK